MVDRKTSVLLVKTTEIPAFTNPFLALGGVSLLLQVIDWLMFLTGRGLVHTFVFMN